MADEILLTHNWLRPLEVSYEWPCAVHSGIDGSRHAAWTGGVRVTAILSTWGRDEFLAVEQAGNDEFWTPCWWEPWLVESVSSAGSGEVFLTLDRFGYGEDWVHPGEKVWSKKNGFSEFSSGSSLPGAPDDYPVGSVVYRAVKARIMSASSAWYTATAADGEVTVEVDAGYLSGGLLVPSMMPKANRVTPQRADWERIYTDVISAAGYRERVPLSARLRRTFENEYLLQGEEIDGFLRSLHDTLRGRSGEGVFDTYIEGEAPFTGRLLSDSVTLSYHTAHVATTSFSVGEV